VVDSKLLLVQGLLCSLLARVAAHNELLCVHVLVHHCCNTVTLNTHEQKEKRRVSILDTKLRKKELLQTSVAISRTRCSFEAALHKKIEVTHLS